MNTKNNVAILLYYISNYEKCRVCSKVHWNKKYIVSLIWSLDVMSMLTDILEGNYNIENINLINSFIINNEGIMFQNAQCLLLTKNPLTIQEGMLLSEEEKEVVNLLITIISNCRTTIIKKSIGYKKRVASYLRALHNLPRSLMDDCSCSNQYISCETAMEYARAYLNELLIW